MLERYLINEYNDGEKSKGSKLNQKNSHMIDDFAIIQKLEIAYLPEI